MQLREDTDRRAIRAAAALEARKELARRGLGDFLALMQPDYEQPVHVRAICTHLEALEAREIPRLIVTMPPRHGKTLHSSQGLPAWYLGRRPSEHVILASYGAELAEQNSRRARALVTDPRWPFEAQLATDSAAVGRWHTSDGGGLIAAGVGGGITGFGADLLVIDDPLKGREEADSEAIRESSWRWLTDVAFTRLHKDAVVLLCLTRWHEADLAGRLLNSSIADAWTLLSLPALANEGDALSRSEGEPLWPDRYDASALTEMRETMGSRSFAALYQQAPTSDTGGTFQRRWLEGKYDTLPEGARIVQTVDSAFKTGVANDYSVIATWAADDRFFYLVDVWRRRVEFPDLVRAITTQAERHRPTAVLIEDTAAGQSAIQTLQRETKLPIVPMLAKGSKISRAEAVSPLFEAGKVLLPAQKPAWLHEWIEEHVSFPAGRHDDMVDTTSLALDRLSDPHRSGGGVTGVVFRHRLTELREARAADVDSERQRQRRVEKVTREREKARRRPLGIDDPRYA
jgi:predicted phage terminase large subunit-like protein